MSRSLLLLATLVAGASCYVYTCNEVKRILSSDDDFSVNGTSACVVLPAAVTMPFNDEPYTWYVYNTYIVDTDSGKQYDLTGLQEKQDSRFCATGAGPWTIKSDDPAQFVCTSFMYKYAEIVFIFTSDEPNIVQTSIGGSTATYGKGTHVFVAPEGSMMIQKRSIDDGKQTTLQLYSGAGANEAEERFALMPEKFVTGTSTIVLGPVTTLVIEDDVTVGLTVSSFDEKQDISAAPGFDFSIMSTGRANDLQSSRPSIVVSTRYDINDDNFAYDAVSITGTVFMDEQVGTKIGIECGNIQTGTQTFPDLDKTSDVTINADCTALDITYKGAIAADGIDRSSEVIYLRITSNPDPVLKPATSDPDATREPTTRRTQPPTTPHARPTIGSTTTPRLPSTTKQTPSTTSAASGISAVFAALSLVLSMFL